MRDHHENLTFTPLLAFVERLAAPLTLRLSRRRVKEWCRRQGVQLLRWRDAKLFEGPSSWTVDSGHYRIQVLDEDGRQRARVSGLRAMVEPRDAHAGALGRAASRQRAA